MAVVASVVLTFQNIMATNKKAMEIFKAVSEIGGWNGRRKVEGNREGDDNNPIVANSIRGEHQRSLVLQDHRYHHAFSFCCTFGVLLLLIILY